jgi:hypothetical protein
VSAFLPDDGHTWFNILMDGAPPFAFWAQLRLFSIFFAWGLTTAWSGIALKRGLQARFASAKATPARLTLSPQERQRMGLWLAFDLGLIVCATFVILRTEVVNRVATGTPEGLTRTLLSPASSTGEKMHAIWELSLVGTDESTRSLRHAAQELQPPVNLMAAATLLERNDISELPLLEDYLLRHSSQLEATPENGPTDLASYLRSIKDPAAIPNLIQLMASADVETRRAAVQALWNIESPASIDSLIKGLNDGDVEVRYYCVSGLAQMTGAPGEWDPDRGLFGQNESYYLDHWKAWARDRTPTSP